MVRNKQNRREQSRRLNRKIPLQKTTTHQDRNKGHKPKTKVQASKISKNGRRPQASLVTLGEAITPIKHRHSVGGIPHRSELTVTLYFAYPHPTAT